MIFFDFDPISNFAILLSAVRSNQHKMNIIKCNTDVAVDARPCYITLVTDLASSKWTIYKTSYFNFTQPSMFVVTIHI